VADKAVTDLEVENRFKVLGHELRCLVCQNQTLADSNAELARDLRTEVEAQIRQGKSDSQIKSYLVERYGDFVLYKPELKSSTWLLWGGPFALLAGGALAWTLSRKRKNQSAEAKREKPAMSHEEAKKLLGED
jgi:cytochrome c-type biogenesis protein CcmH